MLAAAGLEPSARAGLLADVRTLEAEGAEALGVCTALTAQGQSIFASQPVETRFLRTQLKALRQVGEVHAVKLGLVDSAAQLTVLVGELGDVQRWVVDPVVRTSRGEPLSRLTARDYWNLGKRVESAVLTPNLPELAWLLGETRGPDNAEELVVWARALCESGYDAVVVKGGHAQDPTTVADWVVTRRRALAISSVRLARATTQRGTGCRHASALAAALARGEVLDRAARRAQAHVAGFLGSGSGA